MADGPGRYLARGAGLAAAAVAVLSLVYAVFYLFVAPSAQRAGDVDAFFRSYLAHPTGLRVASLCLFVSGLLTTVVYAALHATPGTVAASPRTWLLALGAVSGVATSAHGLADLLDLDKLAHTYGIVLGVDMVLLFVSSALAATVPILITGVARVGTPRTRLVALRRQAAFPRNPLGVA